MCGHACPDICSGTRQSAERLRMHARVRCSHHAFFVSDGPDQRGHTPRGLRQRDTLAAEHFAQGRRSHHMLVCPMVPTMVTCREAALGNLARGWTDMCGGASPPFDSESGGPDHGHMPRSVAEAPLRRGRACTGGGDMSKSGTSVPSASTQRVVAVCVCVCQAEDRGGWWVTNEVLAAQS